MAEAPELVGTSPIYIVQPSGECGYCNGQKNDAGAMYSLKTWGDYHSNVRDVPKHCTLGFQVLYMTPAVYDELCNSGFRRSGMFVYRVDLLRNCCRLYTIRTTPNALKLRKDLKKTLRRYTKRISNVSHSEDSWIDQIMTAERDSQVFKTIYEPARYSDEKYALFARYQESIHKDYDHSKSSFERFLCQSPFGEESDLGTAEEFSQLNNWKDLEPKTQFLRRGAVHECYYWKGNLIALSVLDFLDSGISSVYFIWDPNYRDWSLGKVSALRELALVHRCGLSYYYMGLYAMDCDKMNYKAQYGAQLLDVSNNLYAELSAIEGYLHDSKLFALKSDDNFARESPINSKLANKHAIINKGCQVGIPNVAEALYGVDGIAYKDLDQQNIHKKLSALGFQLGTTDISSDIYQDIINTSNETLIPDVMPGLLPLTEILELCESGKINQLNLHARIYDTKRGKVRLIRDFHSETNEIKTILFNTIRVLGLHIVKKSVIFI